MEKIPQLGQNLNRFRPISMPLCTIAIEKAVRVVGIQSSTTGDILQRLGILPLVPQYFVYRHFLAFSGSLFFSSFCMVPA